MEYRYGHENPLLKNSDSIELYLCLLASSLVFSSDLEIIFSLKQLSDFSYRWLGK